MPSRTFPIINRLGLHARAAARFVSVANEYEASVVASRDGKEADGRSIIRLLTLNAKCGTELDVSADGHDARALLDALQELLADRFGEDE